MGRLLDENNVLRIINSAQLIPDCNYKKLVKLIKELPSAQPEIIRCEDCDFWEQESICEGYCSECDLHGCDEDHYCGYAVRRENGQTN